MKLILWSADDPCLACVENEGCESRVREAFGVMADLAKQGDDGYSNLTQTFRLCKPLDRSRGYKQLIGWVRNAFASMAMVNYPYPATFLAPLPAWPVKAACKLITEETDGALVGLAKAASLFYLVRTDLQIPYRSAKDGFYCCFSERSKMLRYLDGVRRLRRSNGVWYRY